MTDPDPAAAGVAGGSEPSRTRLRLWAVDRFINCIHPVCVRIIKEGFIRDAAMAYPKAAKYLTIWIATVRAARWQNLTDLRRVYPSADLVAVGSGKLVVVFNGCGNTYRLIAAVHFDRGMVYTLRCFTHAEDSKDKWKDEL
jgi:mRNA interferase HigB